VLSAAILILAYNVDFESTAVDKSLALIESSGADVLCLEEVTKTFQRKFERRLGNVYRYRAFFPGNGTWGLAIASKQPLVQSRRFAQKPHRMPALEARTFGVTVACLHLFPPSAKRDRGKGVLATMKANAKLRAEQARAIVERYAGEAGPVVLAGDLNEGSGGEGYAVLRDAGFRDACDSAGSACGATWPGDSSRLPAVARIDHVLARGIAIGEAKVMKGGGSDHYAVAAGLTR
jgi:endonuclease/exonuclease/phosphatase (EEP) superfamily protein YafD